jgi:hypothetical protein
MLAQFGISPYNKPKKSALPAEVPSVQKLVEQLLHASHFPARRRHRPDSCGWPKPHRLDQVTKSAKDAATSAATGATQTALGPAVTPVLDLLKQGQSKVASIESAAQTV